MNADGTGIKRITKDGTFDSHPTWAPDGSKIAFSRFSGNTDADPDGDYEIYVVNADGTNPVNLTNNGANNEYEPTWSPDGYTLAYTRQDAEETEIYAMNADGGDQVNISLNPGPHNHELVPAFSPDGNAVDFVSNRDGRAGDTADGGTGTDGCARDAGDTARNCP